MPYRKLIWTDAERELITVEDITYSEFKQQAQSDISRSEFYRWRQNNGIKSQTHRRIKTVSKYALSDEQKEWIRNYNGIDWYEDFYRAYPDYPRRTYERMREYVWRNGIARTRQRRVNDSRCAPLEQRKWIIENAPHMTERELADKSEELFGFHYKRDLNGAPSSFRKLLRNVKTCKNRKYANGIGINVPEGMMLVCIDGDKSNLKPDNVRLIPKELYQRVSGYVGKLDPDTFDLVIEWAKLKSVLFDRLNVRVTK